MKGERLINILHMLVIKGSMTAGQIAQELSVSERTVYRDIEAMQIGGVPVYAVQGPHGGFRLVDGYRTLLTGLNRQEVETLFLIGLSGPAAELGLGQILMATELKLLAALPRELRPQAGKVRERFLLDPPGWFREGDAVPFLQGVAKAVWHGFHIDIRYKSWDGTIDVGLDPLAVALKGGSWYLVGVSTDTAHEASISAISARRSEPDSVRVFRVSRIVSLSATTDSFERPADFDLATYWAEATARFETSMYRGDVTLRMSPAAMEKVAYMLGPEAQRAAADRAEEPDAQGWRRTVLPSETLPNQLADILQFGAEVEVIEPADLRDAVAQTAIGLGDLYG